MSKAKAKSHPHKTPSRQEKAASSKAKTAAHAAKSPAKLPGKAASPSAPDNNGHAVELSPEAQLAQVQQALGSFKSSSGVELTEKVKELLRLAQEQGYLTYNDINDALP